MDGEDNVATRNDTINSYVSKKHISRETWSMLCPNRNKALGHRDKHRLARETSRQNEPNKLSIHKNIDFKILLRGYRIFPFDRVTGLRRDTRFWYVLSVSIL